MVHTGITCITLLAALLLLASAFSDLISPTVWIVAAYLGLFFPIILLTNLLWLSFLLLTRHWKMALILLGFFLCCSPRIWRYCPLNFISPEPITNVMVENGTEKKCPIDTFRVLTFNTLMIDKSNINRGTGELPAMDLVKNCGADVVCLQEYHVATSPKGYTQEKLHDMVKKQYPYSHFVLNYGSKTTDGIMVFSKWPLKIKEEIDMSGKINYHASYTILEYKGRDIALINCHLRTNEISKKNREVIKEQTKHFEVDSLKRMGQGVKQMTPSFITRTEQVSAIRRYLDKHENTSDNSRPLLICGDLNDTPISFTYRSLRGDLGDTWEDAGLGMGISFREAPFWIRIDHIFHSKHFHALDIDVLREEKSSDHYPVMATFQLLPANE